MGECEQEIILFEKRKCPCGNLLTRRANWFNVIAIAKASNLDVNKFLPKVCNPKCKNLLPVWNKGLTKSSSESVAKYANSRTGDNNPIKTWIHDQQKKNSWRKNISNALLGKNLGLSYEQIYGARAKIIRQRMSDSAKKRKVHGNLGYHHSLQTRRKIAQKTSLYLATTKYKASFLQERLFFSLKELLGERVFLEHRVGFYVVDIAYENFAIEVDGDFWHCNENLGFYPRYNCQRRNIRNDKAKNSYLANLGWQVVRIWVSELSANFETVVSVLVNRITKNHGT